MRRMNWSKVRVGTVLAIAGVAASGALAPAAVADAEARLAAATVLAEAKAPKVTLKAARKSVTEGDVLKLTARVTKARTAKRVTLQRWDKPYSWATGQWVTVKSRKASAKVTFRTTVTSQNKAKYRLSVTYKKRAKPVRSKATTVTVWRWVPLRNISSYYSTSWTGHGTAMINGRSYPGWGPFTISSGTAWESRFTPGRACSSLRGVAGVTDLSDDGAVGTVEVIADGRSVWRSPRMEPGSSTPFRVRFSGKPYRISLLATNVSADVDAIDAWPVIGDAELYCTGL